MSIASTSKINYIIATWAGKDTKDFQSKLKPENTLKFHLEKIAQFKHNLSQITVMCPKCPKHLEMSGFYDISKSILDSLDCPLVFEECENYGYSNGQWMKCYELYTDFDYYILVEDDYCPYQDHFDSILVDLYLAKFPKNIGKLCGYIQGTPLQKNHKFPLHWESAMLVSRDTFEKLYNCDRWKGRPRDFLNAVLVKNKKLSSMKERPEAVGGFFQVNFSLLFTLIGIPVRDFSKEFIVPYYEKERNEIYHLKHGVVSTVCFKEPAIKRIGDRRSYLMVPLQFYFI